MSKAKRMRCDIFLSLIFIAIVSTAVYFAYNKKGIFAYEIGTNEGVLLAINYSINIFASTFLAMVIDKNKTMYWKNFNEIIIINSLHIDLTDYSIMGGISVFVETFLFLFVENECKLFVVIGSFVVGVVMIAFIVWSYLSIYIWKDYYLKKIENEKVDFDMLKAYTLRAIKDTDVVTVNDNISFLLKKIDAPEAKQAQRALDDIVAYLNESKEVDSIIRSKNTGYGQYCKERKE